MADSILIQHLEVVRSRLKRDIETLGKIYTVSRKNYVSDGVGGHIVSTTNPIVTYALTGIIQNGSVTQSGNDKKVTDGGYEIKKPVNMVVLYDSKDMNDNTIHIGDRFSDNNNTYIVMGVNNVCSLNVYYNVSLQSHPNNNNP